MTGLLFESLNEPRSRPARPADGAIEVSNRRKLYFHFRNKLSGIKIQDSVVLAFGMPVCQTGRTSATFKIRVSLIKKSVHYQRISAN